MSLKHTARSVLECGGLTPLFPIRVIRNAASGAALICFDSIRG